MPTLNVRPDFEIESELDPESLMDRLRSRLATCPRCTGMSVGRHAELFVPESEQRIWSPWLSVTAREDHERTILRGRFAPHPSIWTLYLFLAFALGFTLLVGLSWGYAQWATETTPWALGSIPLVLVSAAGLYGISLLGQRLSASQMKHLRTTLYELIAR